MKSPLNRAADLLVHRRRSALGPLGANSALLSTAMGMNGLASNRTDLLSYYWCRDHTQGGRHWASCQCPQDQKVINRDSGKVLWALRQSFGCARIVVFKHIYACADCDTAVCMRWSRNRVKWHAYVRYGAAPQLLELEARVELCIQWTPVRWLGKPILLYDEKVWSFEDWPGACCSNLKCRADETTPATLETCG